MPVSGLSLLGFMDHSAAKNYLATSCIVADDSPQELSRLWNEAKNLKGLPIAGAGQPEIQDMPLCFQAYLQGLTANPRFALTVQNSIPQFKLVEIDPLLAYQFHIEVGKADSLGALAGDAPQVADMLPICLPHSFENIACNVSVQPNGMLIRTRSFNLRVFNAGKIGADVAQQFSLAGIAFGPTSPLIQVIRFEGRCYLRNGLHRAYAFRKARASHMPCLLLDVSDFGQVGAVGGGATFERPLLESTDPPTCGHFTQGRAYLLSLRRLMRIINVTWSEHVFPDED